MGQSDARHDVQGETLSDSLDRDITQRRERLAELGLAQRLEERAFADLRTQAALIRAAIRRNREQLIGDSREKTTLLGELDQLLQRQVQRDNLAQAAVEPPEPSAAAGVGAEIVELNPRLRPAALPPQPAPTGTSEWRLGGGVPPPRPHAGPPPTATGLAGPRAPDPPSQLAVGPVPFETDPDGDSITQVTQRPAAMRSAAFQPQARPLGPPPIQSSPQPPGLSQPLVHAPPQPLQAAPRRDRSATPAPLARRQVAMAVEVALGGADPVVGFSERVSEGGLVVLADSPRRVGDSLPIQFTLPGHHRTIACEVEVSQVSQVSRLTHSAPTGGAVSGLLLRFVSLSAHDRAALARFIAQREALLT